MKSGEHTGAAKFKDWKFKGMARYLACLYYRLLNQGQIWVDRGTEEFNRRSQQRELAALERKARKNGLQLVPAA